MITLKYVTLVPEILALKCAIDTKQDYVLDREKNIELYNFLIKNKIYDYERLKEFMMMGYPILNNNYFAKKLIKAEDTVTKINLGKKDIQTYSFEAYQFSEDDLKAISFTDETTKLSDILITHPMYPNTMSTKTSELSITLAKYLAGKITVNGNNALATVIMNVGSKKVNDLANNISFYEMQLQRICASSLSHLDGNLFYKDKDEKIKLIRAELQAITAYMVENSTRFIWGNLTDNGRKKLMSAIANDEDTIIKRNLLNILANYVTLEETQEGLIRTRAIDRFIKYKL